ncbi:MAG: AP2 domain-containing protein [Phycisphaerae bacterium]|nr:AP2 domain-containing protein [Phycisphaerae bacterium]
MLRSTSHRSGRDDTLGERDDMDGGRVVPLSQGRFALVDAGDYAAVMAYSWYAASSYKPLCANPLPASCFASSYAGQEATEDRTGEQETFYAVRKERGRTIRMHREIMGAGPEQVVDHINHDGLDNRRCNLRVCRHAENVRNQRGQRGRSSRYKGVSRDRRGKWRAQIWYNGQHFYLGLFESEAAAAEAYNAKARELFGEFAY